jgi:crossover junction endodeoxyribonuclease RuvC
MSIVYIGVDPGVSGGIAWKHGGSPTMHAEKMPQTDRDILELLHDIAVPSKRAFAVLEKVGAMPGQGVSSTFKFGMGFGGLKMALTAAQCPFELVTPQKWKKEFGLIFPKKLGLTKTQIKNKDKEKAQQLFPDLKITHATADAILLCEYAARMRH